MNKNEKEKIDILEPIVGISFLIWFVASIVFMFILPKYIGIIILQYSFVFGIISIGLSIRDKEFVGEAIGLTILIIILTIIGGFIIHTNASIMSFLTKLEVKNISIAQIILTCILFSFLLAIESIFLFCFKYKWDRKKSKFLLFFSILSFVLSIGLIYAIRFV